MSNPRTQSARRFAYTVWGGPHPEHRVIRQTFVEAATGPSFESRGQAFQQLWDSVHQTKDELRALLREWEETYKTEEAR